MRYLKRLIDSGDDGGVPALGKGRGGGLPHV